MKKSKGGGVECSNCPKRRNNRQIKKTLYSSVAIELGAYCTLWDLRFRPRRTKAVTKYQWQTPVTYSNDSTTGYYDVKKISDNTTDYDMQGVSKKRVRFVFTYYVTYVLHQSLFFLSLKVPFLQLREFVRGKKVTLACLRGRYVLAKV